MADIQEEPEAQNRQQPNWGIILESLRNITGEAAFIPNVPSFNQGDRILLALNRLSQEVVALRGRQATLREGQDALRQGQDALRQGQDDLKREHATIQQRPGALEQQLVALDSRLADLRGEVQELRDQISRQ